MARTGRPPAEVDVEEIRRLTEAGWRMQRIADHLGTTKGIVWGAMKRHDIPRHSQHSLPGDLNPSWKGGRYTDADGYVYIYQPAHPYCTVHGYVREHRLVMEQVLGRYLTPEEVVHHRDDNRQNNAPENLELFQRNADHLHHTLKGKVPDWTPEGKAKISAASRGQARPPISEETRQRMREAQSTRPRTPLSPETKAKISAARRGKPGNPHSPETRERLRQAALLREAAKRTPSREA